MLVLNDFSTSVSKALSEIDPEWRDYKGLIICGTHTPHDTEQMIDMIHTCRTGGMPFLGICFGYQLASIEYARNVLGIKDATSEEFGNGTFVVKKRDVPAIGLWKGESYWSKYDVIPEIKEKLEFPKNFFLSPAHPEYQSIIGKPHPLLVNFLKYAK